MAATSRSAPACVSAQDRVERGEERTTALQRLAQLDRHGSAQQSRLLGRKHEGGVARRDLGIDADTAGDEHRLALALPIDQEIAVDRGGARAGHVQLELGAFRRLLESCVGQARSHFEFALADDDRHGDAVDRHEIDGEAAFGRGHAFPGGSEGLRPGHSRERHVHPVFAVGQFGGGPRADADGLGLGRRQGHAARRVADHLQRGPLGDIRLGFVHGLECTVGCHAAQLQRDAVGRFLAADVRQDHFTAAPAVENQPRRRDQQVALSPGRTARGERNEGRCNQQRP